MKKFICLILMLLLVSGCSFKGEYKVDIKKNKEVNFGITIAFDDQLLDYFIDLYGNSGQDYTDEQRWEMVENLIIEENGQSPIDCGFVSSKYETDEYKGMVFTKTFSSIDDLVSDDAYLNFNKLTNTEDIKMFTNNDGVYSLKMYYEGSEDESSINSYMDFKLIITLPDEPIQNNATTVSEDGRTLTWDLTKLTSKDFILDFKINAIPWNYIYIGGGLLLVVVFLLIASSYMKKKGKIDVSKMPKGIKKNSDKTKKKNNSTNQDVSKKESINDLKIDDEVLDSLNKPVGNNDDEVVNLAMVDSYKSTKAPIKKDKTTKGLFNFDEQNNENK